MFTEFQEEITLPVSFEAQNFSKNTRIDWHWHEEMEISIVMEGSLSCSILDHETVLNKGDAVFLSSNVRHSYTADPDSYCLLYILKFVPRVVGGSPDSVFWQKYLLPIMNHPQQAHFLRQENAEDRQLIETMHEACTVFRHAEDGYEFLLRNLLSSVIYSIYRSIPSLSSDMNTQYRKNEERIREMLKFIEDHYGENITLDQIASSGNVSVSECLRTFKRMVHTTPVRYLIRYRLMKAAELIIETTMNISEIAYSCGFEEMSYFTRSFRRMYFCTPSQYRSSYRK